MYTFIIAGVGGTVLRHKNEQKKSGEKEPTPFQVMADYSYLSPPLLYNHLLLPLIWRQLKADLCYKMLEELKTNGRNYARAEKGLHTVMQACTEKETSNIH